LLAQFDTGQGTTFAREAGAGCPAEAFGEGGPCAAASCAAWKTAVFPSTLAFF